MPAHHLSDRLLTIAVLTDEHFSCPPGFGRVLDITDPQAHHAALDLPYHAASTISTTSTRSNSSARKARRNRRTWPSSIIASKAATCSIRPGTIRACAQSTSPIPSDHARSAITSRPNFSVDVPGQKGRHTREPYPDWDSDLIYVTDGNGGGLTALRYTGPLPTKPPIPGVR